MRAARQPVHTVYGGAHLFRSDVAQKFGKLALAAMRRDADGDASVFAEAFGLGLDSSLAEIVRARVLAKLEREPIEDLRIDFEDGFGPRRDAEEDAEASRTAAEVAAGVRAGTLPRGIGLRIKSLGPDTRARGLRTLERFLTSFANADVSLPPGFVVTLPKITSLEEIRMLVEALANLERTLGLGERALRFEVMVETTESLIDGDGRWALPQIVRASDERLVAAHLGAYDLAASCDVAATHQTLGHPLNDFARAAMQMCLARTDVWLSDGATNVLPIPVHRVDQGAPDSEERRARILENRRAIHAAWGLHVGNIQRSLARGIYQGWDLHPAQLPARYAAVFAFFVRDAVVMGRRLLNFVERASQATALGNIFDDAATGHGLLNFFVRAEQCGAMDDAAIMEASGLTIEELATRSFPRLLTLRAARIA